MTDRSVELMAALEDLYEACGRWLDARTRGPVPPKLENEMDAAIDAVKALERA